MSVTTQSSNKQKAKIVYKMQKNIFKITQFQLKSYTINLLGVPDNIQTRCILHCVLKKRATKGKEQIQTNVMHTSNRTS